MMTMIVTPDDPTAAELARIVLQGERPPTFQHIAVAGIRRATYQRPVDQRRVDGIVNEYVAARFQPLEISRRDDGVDYCMDGGHRLAAAPMLGMQVVPAMVHRGLTETDEAILFWHFQRDRRPLSVWDAFQARVVGRDPTALAILEIVSSHDLRIGRGSNYDITAVATLERIYRLSPALLDQTVRVILEAWPLAPGRFSNHLLGGVAIILRRFSTVPKFSDDRLAGILSKHSPVSIITAAKGEKGSVSGNERLDFSTARVIRNLYSRSSKHRLPALTDSRGRRLPKTKGDK
jgi:hypothetical protein